MSLLETVRREIYSVYQTSGCADERHLLRWYRMLSRYGLKEDPMSPEERKRQNHATMQEAEQQRLRRVSG